MSPQNGHASDDGGGALESLLTDAAGGSTARRWLPGRGGIEVAARLAVRPDRVIRRGGGLAAELARVAVGRSEVAPEKGDRRFTDPAWQGNPLFRRLAQTYLATGATVDGVIQDADASWKAERRVRFAASNVVDALAPSNFPLLNPAVLKATLDTGGSNFVSGAGHFVRDMRKPPRVPSMVDKSAFDVGESLALTPGEVVLRTEVFELIQYAPQTKMVRDRPLLIVPPMINKFYIVDLAPDRSMIEYLVREGQPVFVMSWRNPDESHAEWNLDSYAGAVLEGLEAAESISGADKVHILGLCAGGITASCAVAHLADIGEQDRIAGLTLGVTVLDNHHAGMTGALVDHATAAAATAESARKGYLDGRALAGVFAWLRPNDLIWNYWVNNYLLGKNPPAFDVLYWNADTTRMPAGLHRDFMRLSLDNSIVHPGELTVLGTPVDLGAITVDSYLVAGIADHIVPWQNAYRTTQLFGSDPRFILSTSGHIAALVNPPGNEKASFQVSADGVNPETADEFLERASKHRGTWWVDWSAWLGERSGEERRAPKMLGGKDKRYTPLGPAPGTYVLEE
jgi:polyhydroxyalkanoate synthase